MIGIRALEELEAEYATCARCPLLCESRTAPVAAAGSASAPIMVVGEAPGDEEDEEGVSFVGPSGRFFMELLRLAWPDQEAMRTFDRFWDDHDEANVEYWDEIRTYFDNFFFWSNVVLCRTPELRPPAPAEIKNCRDRLFRQVYAVDPILILALGKEPSKILLGKNVQISTQSGDLFDIALPSFGGMGREVRYSMMSLMSPGHLKSKGDSHLIERKRGATYETIENIKWALHLVSNTMQKQCGADLMSRAPEFGEE